MYFRIFPFCVQNKIKIIFFGRAISNLLSTYANLCKRKILAYSWCPWCNFACETAMHALETCGYAKRVWMLSSFGAFMGNSSIKLQRAGLACNEER